MDWCEILTVQWEWGPHRNPLKYITKRIFLDADETHSQQQWFYAYCTIFSLNNMALLSRNSFFGYHLLFSGIQAFLYYLMRKCCAKSVSPLHQVHVFNQVREREREREKCQVLLLNLMIYISCDDSFLILQNVECLFLHRLRNIKWVRHDYMKLNIEVIFAEVCAWIFLNWGIYILINPL